MSQQVGNVQSCIIICELNMQIMSMVHLAVIAMCKVQNTGIAVWQAYPGIVHVPVWVWVRRAKYSY